MKEEIKKHLIEYNKKHGYPTDDSAIIEALRECGKKLYEVKLRSRRWWNDIFIVKEIDGMLIGYEDSEITGDEGLGFEFDERTICNVKPIEQTITGYMKV